MKQLTILSGKGGTGKTSLTASFAVLAKNAVLADCDVDAPDLHLLLHPRLIKTQDFTGSKTATIDKEKCIACGLCKEKCLFNAITSDFVVDKISCEGCGVCKLVCPADAIALVPKVSGQAFISKTKYGFMSHALLYPGESNSGKLVTLVRQNAKVLAEKEKCDLIIIDGPPGIGCPVIASISGVDAALVVTEPTLSGIHDLTRVLGLLEYFHVVPFVCINMYDVNTPNTNRILAFCKQKQVELAGLVPFDAAVTKAMVAGETVIEYAPTSGSFTQITDVWKKISNFLNCEK
jgi:MinD superfamily P-loop ATPase